jgi:hypothetical protein
MGFLALVTTESLGRPLELEHIGAAALLASFKFGLLPLGQNGCNHPV